MMYEQQFLVALAVTVTVETLCLFVLLKEPRHLLLFTGIFSSCATLPYVWFVLPIFIEAHYLYVLSSEGIAVVLEGIIYCSVLRLPLKRALVVSLICNAASFLIGLLLRI
jgi:hypothetical protein